MHYVFHILIHCIVARNLGYGGQAAKTAVSPEVLTTFAKNIASVLSPGLLSDFQNLSTNRTVITAPHLPRKKSSLKDPVSPYSIRSRRSEPDNESSSDNQRGQVSALNFHNRSFQSSTNIDTEIDTSNDISDIRAASFSELINEAPARYIHHYHLPDFLHRSAGPLVVPQLSNLDTSRHSYYVAGKNNKLGQTGDSKNKSTNDGDQSESTKQLRVLQLNEGKDYMSSAKPRLSVRSPAAGAYNNPPNHRPAYAPVYSRTNSYSARQVSTTDESKTDDAPGNNGNMNVPAPSGDRPERPNYGEYGFRPYSHYPDALYGGPNYNFPAYGNNDDGVNSTKGPGFNGFGGYGFDPYYYGPFNRYPNFYGQRPTYFPRDNPDNPNYQPEDNQPDNNSTSDRASPIGHPYGYPYGHQQAYRGKPTNEFQQFGFDVHGLGPFKGPFGHVPGIFLDSFKKASPYPGGFHREPFLFPPQPHFHQPYGGFYPNFRRPDTSSTTPSEPVSSNDANLAGPESVSDSIINADAEIVSATVQKDVVIRNTQQNTATKSKTDQKRATKRFVYIGSERYRD